VQFGEETFEMSDELRNKILGSVNPMKAVVDHLFSSNEHYDWVGIYLLCTDELRLGPFKGPPTPHEVIPLNKGICGAAVTERRTINLPDVRADDRFIACSTSTRSELVVPIWFEGDPIAELDIDSNTPSAFSPRDEQMVECLAELIAPMVKEHCDELMKDLE
jgi:putative methionine-R-sulfoxide reductase with GAF domain